MSHLSSKVPAHLVTVVRAGKYRLIFHVVCLAFNVPSQTQGERRVCSPITRDFSRNSCPLLVHTLATGSKPVGATMVGVTCSQKHIDIT